MYSKKMKKEKNIDSHYVVSYYLLFIVRIT